MNVVCEYCEGDGYVIETDTEAGCCQQALSDGSCCGYAIPIPVEIQVQCEACSGEGYIYKHELTGE